MIGKYDILRAQLAWLKEKRNKSNMDSLNAFVDEQIKEVEAVINGTGSLDYTFVIERTDGSRTAIDLQALKHLLK